MYTMKLDGRALFEVEQMKTKTLMKAAQEEVLASKKKEAFQKLEDTHKELMTLQLKQKSDFKTHKNFLNRELKGHIDESLRVDALKKISKLSKSFGKCMKFQEKTMTEVRNLNDIEIDI